MRTAKIGVKPTPGREYRDFRDKVINIERPDVSIEEIVRICCEHLDVRISRLTGKTKRGIVTDARVIVTSLAVEHFSHRVNKVARYLNKAPGTVSWWLAQAQERATADASFRQRLRDLANLIIDKHLHGYEGALG